MALRTRRNQASDALDTPSPRAAPCEHCGDDRGWCRTVERGFWCQAKGLIGPETFILPTPDPISVAIATDPDVVAAETARAEAAVIYEAAEASWLRAVEDHRSAVLRGQTIVTPDGQLVTTIDPKRMRSLERAIEDATDLRDDADEKYRHAAAGVWEAQQRVRMRLTGTRTPGNRRKRRGHVLG